MGRTDKTLNDLMVKLNIKGLDAKIAQATFEHHTLYFKAKITSCFFDKLYHWQDKEDEKEANNKLFEKVLSGNFYLDDLEQSLSIAHTKGECDEVDANNPDL